VKYAIKCIDHDGEEEYVMANRGTRIAAFTSKLAAQEQANFLKMGVADQYQSINVVAYPKRAKP
jgi:hypothetical protein